MFSEPYQESSISESVRVLQVYGKDGEVLLRCLMMMHDLAWGCCYVIVVMVMGNSTVEKMIYWCIILPKEDQLGNIVAMK